MTRQILTTVAVCIVALIVITSPVAAQQDLSDLTTYTEVDGSGTVSVVSPSEIRFENHPDDSFSAVYEGEGDISGKSITMEFDLIINSSSGQSAFAMGLYEGSVVPDGSAWTDVYGIRTNQGTRLDAQNPFSQTTSSITDIGTDSKRHIKMEYSAETGVMNLTVYQSEAGNTVAGSFSETYPVAQNYSVVAFASDDTRASGATKSGRITNYTVSVTDHGNIGEDIDNYDKTAPTGLVNTSSNWITTHDLQDSDTVAISKTIGEENYYEIKYRMIFGQRTQNSGFVTGVGYEGLADSTTESVGLRYGLSSGQTVRTSYHYWGNSPTSQVLNNDETYYVTTTVDRNNATVTNKIYSDENRTAIVYNHTAVFPAGEEYPKLYLLRAPGAGGDRLNANIGYFRFTELEVKNINGDFNTWQVGTFGNDDFNRTRNWVSVRDISTNSHNLYNVSGPGAADASIDFRFYADSDSGHRFTIGWSEGQTNDPNSNVLGFGINNGQLGLAKPSNAFSSFGTYSTGQFYYGKIRKEGATLNVSIYNDAGLTNLHASGETAYSNTYDFNHTYAFLPVQNNGNDWSGLISFGNASAGGYIQPFTGNITLEVAPWMAHGSTQTYRVIVTGNGNDVTSEATVTSGNTTVITVSGNQLLATSDESIAERVMITATYDSKTDSANVTVANRTLEHITIMPPEQYPSTFVGVDEDQASFGLGGEIQWILFAVLVGAMGSWRMRNEYIGLGVISGLLILFWTFGTVSLGYVLVGVFYAIFSGYLLRETPSRSDTNVGGFN